MNNFFVQFFRILSESFIIEICGEYSQHTVELCARFIVNEHKKIAYVYRFILTMIVIYFNLESVLIYRTIFIKLPTNERSEIIRKWKFGKTGFKRQFIKLYFNLALLSCFDSEEMTDKLGIDRNTYLRTLSFYSGASDD
jgi:hypothetical protein